MFFGLDADWKALVDGFVEAGNKTDALGEQKAELEERIAKIHETYREIIEGASFVVLDCYASSDPETFVITHIDRVEIAKD